MLHLDDVSSLGKLVCGIELDWTKLENVRHSFTDPYYFSHAKNQFTAITI